MAASQIVVCNMAISHLGSGKTISSLTERSDESIVCATFLPEAIDATLRDVDWTFAKKYSALGLVTSVGDTGHVNDEWGYSYRYPSSCVKLRRIKSGKRNDQSSTRIPYLLARDASGLLVMTDAQNAVMEYTHRVDSPALWPSDFTLCVSFRLSTYIAPRLTNGDPWKAGARCAEMYRIEAERAKVNAYNEEQREQDPDSEFITVRN